MLYVVEIVGPNGGRARKEYESVSIRGALKLANFDLRNYPQCEIVDVWVRPDQMEVDTDPW